MGSAAAYNTLYAVEAVLLFSFQPSRFQNVAAVALQANTATPPLCYIICSLFSKTLSGGCKS